MIDKFDKLLNGQIYALYGQYFLATSVTPNVRYSSDWTSCVTCSRTGQFYIKLHNHGKSTALAIINSIKVIIDECYQPFISRSKQQPMKLVATERFREKEILRIRPINTRNKIRKTLIAETSTIQSTNLNSSFLLRDIFGDAFAKFLEDDSDGLIGNQRQFSGDIENRQKQVYKKNNNQNNEPFILTTTTTTTIQTLPFVLNLLECNTIGGCLFDHSMCSYHYSQLSRGSTFQRVRLHDRNFMQAFTRPNTVAVLETDTSFMEEYKIVFDVLEYTEGERFYGCCYNTELESEALINIRRMLGGKRPSELFCPFATEAHSTPIIWKTQRFTCPIATKRYYLYVKIMEKLMEHVRWIIFEYTKFLIFLKPNHVKRTFSPSHKLSVEKPKTFAII
ncbi:hypothetical protein DINM_007208 [Dirofilaria immitis]|nr:hypothetical protein [Dirofilaria immitis]